MVLPLFYHVCQMDTTRAQAQKKSLTRRLFLFVSAMLAGKSELRASCNEAFADFRVRILLGEVVDEHLSEFLSSRIPLGLIFVIPLRLRRILVGILRVEDFRSNAFELRRDLETEVRDLLRRSFVDGTAVDSVDDATRILDGDALAIAVPARVDEVCLRAVRLYALNELMRIFRRRQLEECLAEASGERRSRLVMPRSVPASLDVKPERK